MKKPVYNQTSLFGPVYAYLVVISPPDFIKKEVSQIPSFPIQINGWGIFDHGESLTVYLRAAYSASLHNLATTLKKSISMPHISLAKKISPDTFEKLKPSLENLNYSAEWICEEITVLRKHMSEKHLGFKEAFKIPLKSKQTSF